MSKVMQRKLTNWSNELNHSMPKSFLVDGPRDQLVKPNKTMVKKIHERLKGENE
jgi:hypothetical protein